MKQETNSKVNEILETVSEDVEHSQITLDEIDKSLNRDTDNSGFPSLNNETEWNTLPNGIHGGCKKALIVDICDDADLHSILDLALIHIKDVCPNAQSIVFVVSIDKTTWLNEWNKFAQDFKVISPNINIKLVYLLKLSVFVKSLKANSEKNNFKKWFRLYKCWSAFTKVKFDLILNNLSKDARYNAPHDPKVVGFHTSGPYVNEVMAIFAELHPNTKTAKATTTGLKFKNDGKEYAKKTAGVWKRVKI